MAEIARDLVHKGLIAPEDEGVAAEVIQRRLDELEGLAEAAGRGPFDHKKLEPVPWDKINTEPLGGPGVSS